MPRDDILLAGLLRFVLDRGRLLDPAEPGLVSRLDQHLEGSVSHMPGWREWDDALLSELLEQFSVSPQLSVLERALELAEEGDHPAVKEQESLLRRTCIAGDPTRIIREIWNRDPALHPAAAREYTDRLGRLTAIGVFVCAASPEAVRALSTTLAPLWHKYELPHAALRVLSTVLEDRSVEQDLERQVRVLLRRVRLGLYDVAEGSSMAEARAAIREKVADEDLDLLRVALLRSDLAPHLFRSLTAVYRRRRLRSILELAVPTDSSTPSWLDEPAQELVESSGTDDSWRRILEAVLLPPEPPSALALVALAGARGNAGSVVRLYAEFAETSWPATDLYPEWDEQPVDSEAARSCEFACCWLGAFVRQNYPRLWASIAAEQRYAVRLRLDLKGHAVQGGSLGVAVVLAALASLLGRQIGCRRPGDVAVTGSLTEATGDVREVAAETLPLKLDAVRRWNEERRPGQRIGTIMVPAAQVDRAHAVMRHWPREERLRIIAMQHLLQAVGHTLLDPWNDVREACQRQGAIAGEVLVRSLPTLQPQAIDASLQRACAAVEAGSGTRLAAYAPFNWNLPGGEDRLRALAEALAGAIARRGGSSVLNSLIPFVLPAEASGSLESMLEHSVQRLGVDIPDDRFDAALHQGRCVFVIHGTGLEVATFLTSGEIYRTLDDAHPANPIIVLTGEGLWPRGSSWRTINLLPGRSCAADLHHVRMTGETLPWLPPPRPHGEAAERLLPCRLGARAAGGRLSRPSAREFLLGPGLVRYIPLTIVPVNGSADGPRIDLSTLLDQDPATRVLLLGPSGAGKTVELLLLFYRALVSMEIGREGPIPIFASASDFLLPESEDPLLRDLDDVLAARLAGGSLTMEAARSCLDRLPRLLILLDGLSEALAEAGGLETRGMRRASPKALLQRLGRLQDEPYCGASCVITSRQPAGGQYGFLDHPVIRDHFAVYELVHPDPQEQLEQALDYLSAVAEPDWCPGHPRPPAVQRLLTILGPNASHMLRKPILLYVLSAVLHEVECENSLSLADLWDRALTLWTEVGFTPIEGTPRLALAPSTYRHLLELLALEMHRKGLTSLRMSDVVSLFTGYVQSKLIRDHGDLPAWWPRVQGEYGPRPLGARRDGSDYIADCDEIERLVAWLAQSPLLRVEREDSNRWT